MSAVPYQLHVYSQECNNTIGSFVCYCTDGYYLDDDMRTCNDKTRVNILSMLLALGISVCVCTIR